MVLAWGATNTATGYMWAWSAVSTTGTTLGVGAPIIIADDGILDILQVYHSGALGGSPALITYTIEVNLVASALDVQLAINSAGPASDIATQVAVVRGDRIYCKLTNGGPTVTTFPIVSCRFTRN